MTRYAVPAGRHRIEQVIDRSRFLCTVDRVRSVDEAQAFIRAMHAEFPDATHHCWAYVIGGPGSTDRIGLSDDGEPHGTAGRPMLTVLQHADVGDVAAVVTRYFGGTRLGTGGLVKAYGGAVQEALTTLPRAMRVETVTVAFSVAYGVVGALKQRLPALEAELLEEQYAADVHYTVRLPVEQQEACATMLADLTRGASLLRQLP